MQENLQARAGQERLKQALENKSEKPEALVNEMLRQGDVQVTDILSWIADQEEAANAENDLALMEELGDIKKSVNAAYAKLRAGLDQAKKQAPEATEDIDEGWGEAETVPAAAEDIDAGWDATKSESIEGTESLLAGLGLSEQEMQQVSEWLHGKSGGPESAQDAIDMITSKTVEAINRDDFDVAQLDQIIILMSVNELGEALKKELADSVNGVGRKFAERLLTDKGYRESLGLLAKTLEGSLPGGGPKICEKRSLRSLVALREVFGRESGEGDSLQKVLSAMNLTRHTKELRHIENPDPILNIDTLSFDEETGDITTTIDAKLYFDDDSGSGNQVVRNFELNETRVDGKPVKEKTVHHESFVLADQLQGTGLAAELLNDSFTEYEEMGVDSVSLKANDTIGGYTWASSGFGFDKDKNAQLRLINKRMSEAGRKKNGALTGAETTKIRMDALKEFADSPKPEKDKMYKEFVKNLIDDAKTLFTAKLMDKEIDLESPTIAKILKDFDELMDESAVPDKILTVTPQDIALIGRKEFALYSDEENNWYTQDELEEAKRNGLDPKKAGIRESHAGKIGMLGSGWYGKANRGTQFDTVRGKAKRSVEAAKAKRTANQ